MRLIPQLIQSLVSLSASSVVLFLLFVAFPTLALSALPPSYSARNRALQLEQAIESRDEANVGVRGVVQSVEITYNGPQCRQTGEARISLQVTETLQGTTPADTPLVITYNHYLYECPGPIPWQNPLPDEGAPLEAWLRCEGTTCTPVSGYRAFVPLADLRRELEEARAVAGPSSSDLQREADERRQRMLDSREEARLQREEQEQEEAKESPDAGSSPKSTR